MITKGEITMEDWEIVSIEVELDKLRDEREEKEKSAPATGATGAKLGCFSSLLYIGLGLVLFQIVGAFLSIFSR
jgi:hypothetical protein